MKKKNNMPPGRQLTKAGYVRITKGRGKWDMLHRRVMCRLLEQTHPLTLAVLGIERDSAGRVRTIDDEKWDIHHVSGDKRINTPENLMLLSKVIHGRAFVNWKKTVKERKRNESKITRQQQLSPDAGSKETDPPPAH